MPFAIFTSRVWPAGSAGDYGITSLLGTAASTPRADMGSLSVCPDLVRNRRPLWHWEGGSGDLGPGFPPDVLDRVESDLDTSVLPKSISGHAE